MNSELYDCVNTGDDGAIEGGSNNSTLFDYVDEGDGGTIEGGSNNSTQIDCINVGGDGEIEGEGNNNTLLTNLNEDLFNSPSNILEDENRRSGVDINPNIVLNDIRRKNVGRLLIGHLNINSIRNKFDELKSLIHDKFDVFIVSETKIDDSFPVNQFSIEVFF